MIKHKTIFLAIAVLAAVIFIAAVPSQAAVVNIRLGATDGWVKMPDGSTRYIFGFVDITGVPQNDIFKYMGKAQLVSPLIDVTQGDKVYLTLTNLGMMQRPDLDDAHTIHWHGFPNQIPFYDGVPELSISVPPGRDFVYYYEPKDPGAYMYHCHFEPVEHIQMGMTGPLIVRPSLGRNYVYNDAATRFDREYVILLTEMDGEKHDMVEMVQEPDWTDYRPQYWLINGRAFPDIIRPNDDPALPHQPYSTQIRANKNEKVLLRFMHLGYQQHSLQILGIPLQVVGEDAVLKQGLNGENLFVTTSTIFMGAGKTYDVLFTAPTSAAYPAEYPLYNRNYSKQTGSVNGVGGMVTSVKIYESGVPAQTKPNE